jgi:hypothetical protein
MIKISISVFTMMERKVDLLGMKEISRTCDPPKREVNGGWKKNSECIIFYR